MADNITFTSEETGSERPAPVDNQQDYSQEPGRPAWLPQEFKSVDDFVRSYHDTKAAYTRSRQELSQLQGGPEFEEEVDDQRDPPMEPVQDDKLDDAAQNVADKAGVDLTPYQQEYASSGDVSEESRQQIAESLKGVLGDNAREVVDQFIETRRVTHANDMRMYMDAAGGQEAYGNMVNWASENMDPSSIEAYNKQVNSGDRATVLFAIESLRTRYEAANGRAPQLVRGNAPRSGGLPYRSTAEMLTAMRDPRYKQDPAYRDEVQQRIAVSNFGE